MTTEIATVQKKSVLASLSNKLQVEPQKLLATLKSTAFSACRNDEEFVAMCIVANTYDLNPLTKEIYAFPNKKTGAVVPVVGVDGWAKLMNRDPNFDGIEFEEADDHCTCIIYRKDRSRAVKVTEWLSECRSDTEPWRRWPKRMLRHKAMIQAARIAFGFSGIYDDDEAERIASVQAVEAVVESTPTMARRATATELLAGAKPVEADADPALSPALPAPEKEPGVPAAPEKERLAAATAKAKAARTGDFLLS